MTLVCDTGPLYASIDRSDPDHETVIRILRTEPRPHLVPAPVLVELDYFVRKFMDASKFRAFVTDIVSGRFELIQLDPADIERASDLEVTYGDADIGFVDASIIAVCERLNLDSVMTFDRRHFSMVRPAHRRFFNLLP
jgi:hypothetical protein